MQQFLYRSIFIFSLLSMSPAVSSDDHAQDSSRKRHAESSIDPSAPLPQVRRTEGADSRLHQSDLSRYAKTTRIGNPCIDGIFQYGFESQLALTGFLNSVLQFKDGKAIETIEYIKRDLPPSDPTAASGYHFTVDVRCRTKDGHHFLIEMQNGFRDDYHHKALIEHSRMLSRLDLEQSLEDQAKRTELNKDDKRKFWKGIQGLYTIVITNKSFSKEKSHYPGEMLMEPCLVNAYELRHTQQLERHYGDMHHQLVLLMLDNLKASSAISLSSPIERWAYIFKDPSLKTGVRKIEAGKEIEDPSIVAGGDRSIIEFMERINMATLPDAIREKYLSNLEYYNGSIADIEEKAEAKGRMKTILEAVLNARDEEISDEMLSKLLKLNAQEKLILALDTESIKAKLHDLAGPVMTAEAGADDAAGSAGS